MDSRENSAPTPTPEVPFQGDKPKQKKKPSKSKSLRDKTRKDDFRREKGKQAMEGPIKDAIENTLFAGFEGMKGALTSFSECINPTAKVVSLSTRASGFDLQNIFKKVWNMTKVQPDCSVYEAYRVTLAQLEHKLQEDERQEVLPTPSIDRTLYYEPRLSLQEADVISGCRINFNILSHYINSAGRFKLEGQEYYVRVVKPNNGHPLSTSILFSNLGSTVRALANPITPQQVRLDFYNTSPLPGAIWGGGQPRQQDVAGNAVPRRRRRVADEPRDGNWPLLMNPEDFWPGGYNLDDLKDDVNRFKDLLTWATTKNIRFVKNSPQIDYKSEGSRCALVSNYANRLRIPSVQRNVEHNVDWNTSDYPIGNLEEFWIPSRSVDTGSCWFGIAHLFGEIPPEGCGAPFSVREKDNCAATITKDWQALMTVML